MRRDGLGGFDPATYPGWRPDGPCLVHDGRLHDLEVADAAPLGPTALRSQVDAPVLASTIHWSLAHGSNACPDRLVDKGMDRHGAILLPAEIHDWAPAFEARRSPGVGHVPVTLVAAPGRVMRAWMLGIHPDAQDTMDATEGRGARYHVGRVGPVRVAGRWELDALPAYGPVDSTRVLVDGDVPATWPERDQAWAGATLDGGVPRTRTVPPLPDPVPVGWVAPTAVITGV